jgi:hypothetical protein
MIRKAHSLPKGSEERREILAGMGQTWGRQLNELKAEYMQEVVDAAVKILKDEGAEVKGKVAHGGLIGQVTGKTETVFGFLSDQPVSMHYQWKDGFSVIYSEFRVADEVSEHKNKVLSLAPANVASESIYKHFGGLID